MVITGLATLVRISVLGARTRFTVADAVYVRAP